jgi:ankyrin repeat protein
MKLLVLAILFTAACQPGPPISPLIAAARAGDTPRIAQLIATGADVNQRGGVNSWTPLMHAVHKRQTASVRALLDAGADVNLTAGAHGRDTALRLAELAEDQTVATLLREHGAKTPQ